LKTRTAGAIFGQHSKFRVVVMWSACGIHLEQNNRRHIKKPAANVQFLLRSIDRW